MALDVDRRPGIEQALLDFMAVVPDRSAAL